MHFKSILTSIVLSLLVFVSPLQAATWVEQEQGLIQAYRGITQTSAGVLFAVGNGGSIVKSTDDGKNWSMVETASGLFWQSVHAHGETLRATGTSGAVRESTDGGLTWKTISLGTTNHLYDADFSSTTAGYIVGASGSVYAYVPGTNSWQAPVEFSITQTLNDVYDAGNGMAWAVGEEGVLVHTTNSGISWYEDGKVSSEDLYGVWFPSATHGFIVGKNGRIQETQDAGKSWVTKTVNGLTNQTLYHVEGKADEVVIVGDNILLYSMNRGATWSVTDYATQNYTLHDVVFTDAGIYVAGTNDDVKSIILKYETPTPAPESIHPSSPDPQAEAVPGTLIKSVCAASAGVNDPCRAVYFYASDGKRHAFPNEKVFFTWFDGFTAVKEVSSAFLASLPLGKNVTYHPGTKMVKFQSVPTVYAVSKKGLLRAIASETVASQLYGSEWNKQIDDISDAFVGNYTFGTRIDVTTDYDVAAERSSVPSLNENF